MDGLTYRALAVKRGFEPLPHEIDVRDEGQGVVLAHWATRLGPTPTTEELTAITIAERDAAHVNVLTPQIKAMLASAFRISKGTWPTTVEARTIRADYYTALKQLSP